MVCTRSGVCMCNSERVVTAEGRLYSATFRTVPIDNGTCWDMFIGCVAVWSACFFRGSNTPSVSDRWAVEGVHGNYYAITHKPIDLDWTPGGRAARSRARFVTRPSLKVFDVVHSARFLRPQDSSISFEVSSGRLFFISALIREW